MPSSHTPRTFEELGAIEAQRDQRLQRADDARQAAATADKAADILRREELEKARDYTDTPFTPAPALASQILRDFLADVSLGSIASIANTSFEQLSLWLDSPEVTHRLAAMQRTLQRKLHTRALNQTEGFLCAIDRSLTQFNGLESFLDPTTSPADVKNCLRNRECVNKSGHLMLRLVQGLALNPSAQAPTHPPRQRHRRQRPTLTQSTPAPELPERADDEPPNLPPPPAPAAPQPSPLPDLKSQTRDPAPPAPTVHPDAMRYPAGPARKPDSLPALHPAILSGAASSPDAPAPLTTSPALTPNHCTSCTSCSATCARKRVPTEHPP